MAFDWTTLRQPAPEMLVPAREAAHAAAQRVTKAARANLAPKDDDSHSALLWDAKRSALVTQISTTMPMAQTSSRIGSPSARIGNGRPEKSANSRRGSIPRCR